MQALEKSAIAALLQELQPKDKDRELILQEITLNDHLIADGIYWVERKGSRQNIANNVMVQVTKLKLSNLELMMKLRPKGQEVIEQEPLMPRHHVAPRQALIAIWTTIVFFLALSVFLLIRKAYKQLEQDAIVSNKHMLIKKNLGFST